MRKKTRLIIIIIAIVLLVLSICCLLLLNKQSKNEKKYYYCTQNISENEAVTISSIQKIYFNKENVITSAKVKVIYLIQNDDMYNSIISNLKNNLKVKYNDTYNQNKRVSYMKDTSDMPIIGKDINDIMKDKSNKDTCSLKEEEK